MKEINVVILLFDDVDALDFAGPYEVFNLSTYAEADVEKLFTNRLKRKPFRVRTVSKDGAAIAVHNGLNVTPDFSFTTCPDFDLLIVPGGPLKAIQRGLADEETVDWIASHKEKTVASVCTGAFFLAKAGLLEGRSATTNRVATKWLEQMFPNVQVKTGVRYVDEGSVVTSGGVSSGIHMSLHLVRTLFDEEMANRSAQTIEFEWKG
ncbi:transcriptional regulator, AraC family [Geomicrobium sp. JCM 19037]|uniref:DJ-1/PfpI family protein n=1 Tax=Geomicrobium sp. JCM 19037 TaxID=1460634 RepID=UPI00045F22BF|nr:DJ-1/PfpI family protein [Geomicrobium sp. JCM 19037]GAK04573.1 transcriptional regulator, AraC family [Geomicrobium sp. JCM 19037]